MIAGAILARFSAYSKGEKSATNKIKAESEQAAREYERAGYEAGRDGVKKENETIADDKPADRGRFT